VAAQPLDLSLVQLIANPDKYNGKIVRVIGFLKLEFEGNGLYLHEEDYKVHINKNGLWIDPSADMQKRKAKINLRYVVIQGKFNAKETGHMGSWSGSIESVTRCDVVK
jgi:hypothetical protein